MVITVDGKAVIQRKVVFAKSGLKGGVTKESLSSEIGAILRSKGITHRNNADIRSKILNIEQGFRKAVDFLAHTGMLD